MVKKKKKNKSSAKTLNRKQRLQKAQQWLPTYDGNPKNIAKGYRKKFHVDLLCAIKDLQLLGHQFSQEYLDSVQTSLEGVRKQKALAKQKKLEHQKLQDALFSDEQFAFIAGYTSGGAAYGITWEEAESDPDFYAIYIHTDD